MPLIKIETNVGLTDDKRRALLEALSKIVAETIGKPEQYVMVVVNSASMLMSGKPGDTALVDVRSIGGLGEAVNGQLSQRICAFLKQSVSIPPERVYLNYTDVDGANWGWNGKTFG
jgi:phenylpyruvate tautomerase PptA (4-oxalocrotonate tautomerase family)